MSDTTTEEIRDRIIEAMDSVHDMDVTFEDYADAIIAALPDTALAEVRRLREAGQAVIDIWDTPAWKQTEHTVVSIEALRAAISNNATKRLPYNIGKINCDGFQPADCGGEENFTPPDRRKELQRELQRIWEELRALGGFDA